MRIVLRLALVCLIGLAGCGVGGETVVRGTAKYQGKPVYTGTVFFKFDNGEEVFGPIDVEGKYEVPTTHTGNAKVSVISAKPKDPEEIKKRGGSVDVSKMPDPKKWFAVPDKYGDPEKSGLAATIKSGSNAHDIDMQ